LLWNELKNRKMLGYQFMRQKPIDKYIVDFYCSKLKLIVEIDGTSHYGKEEKDKSRQEELEGLGLTFLRFDDLDVKFKMVNVLADIMKWIGGKQ
jgi:very-short-patch-repair endonuclease